MSEETTPVVRPLTPRERLLSLQRKQGHKSKIVTHVIAGEKVEAEVRCPGIALRRSLNKQYKDDAAKQDVAVVIACTYIPGAQKEDGTREAGTEKFYEPSDLSTLLSDDEPTGGWVDRLSQAIGELIQEEITNAQEEQKSAGRK